MDARPWLEQLRGELARRKLPPHYVERFTSELSDHISDFLDDPMSTDVKDSHVLAEYLGSPREVAAAAATEYRHAHFCRRHPIVTFVLLPLLTLPILWAGSIVVFIGMVSLMGLVTDTSAGDLQWAGPMLPFIVGVMVLVPVVMAAAFFCRLARKCEVGWKYALLSCLLLAALSGPAMIDVGIRGTSNYGVLHGTKFTSVHPPAEDGRGFLSFGFGLSSRPSLAQIAQFALPLTIGAWAVARQINRRRDVCMG